MTRVTMGRRQATSAEEMNAASPWRRFYSWRPGQRAAIKRRARRRIRRSAPSTRAALSDFERTHE